MSSMEKSLLELIRRTSSELSDDIVVAIQQAYDKEDDNTNGKLVIELIRESICVAFQEQVPLSLHTSSVQFHVCAVEKFDFQAFQAAAQNAVAEATKLGYLQPGLIDPVTQKTLKTNVGPGSPAFFYDMGTVKELEVRLMLKGDGGENAGAQYSIPNEELSAALDMHGVRRAVLNSLIQAQGRGCGPGIVGVGIGGDRASGYVLAQRQLLRPLKDKNRVKAVAQLEKRIVEDANNLGIGPMGFGGRSTLLAAKVAAETSPRTTCFVSVAYTGWACRRQGVRLDSKSDIAEWLYPVTEGLALSKLGSPEPVARAAARKPSTAISKTAKPKVVKIPTKAKGTSKAAPQKKVAKQVRVGKKVSTAAKGRQA